LVLIIITIIGNIYYYYIVLINLALYSYLFKKITKIYELHKKILVTEKILKLQSKAWRSNDHFLKFKFCLKFFSLLYFIEKDYCYYLHFDISAKVCIKIIRFMYIEGRSSDLMVNILVACVTAMHPPWKKKVGESVTLCVAVDNHVPCINHSHKNHFSVTTAYVSCGDNKGTYFLHMIFAWDS